MPVAESTAPSGDLIVLSFVGGFALATLVFWPLLHRAHNRLASDEPAASTGKHALTKPTPARPATKTTHTASAVIPTSTSDNSAAADDAVEKPSPGAPVAVEAPPAQDLFEQRYGQKFDHVRTRLANLRAEINDQ